MHVSQGCGREPEKQERHREPTQKVLDIWILLSGEGFYLDKVAITYLCGTCVVKQIKLWSKHFFTLENEGLRYKLLCNKSDQHCAFNKTTRMKQKTMAKEKHLTWLDPIYTSDFKVSLVCLFWNNEIIHSFKAPKFAILNILVFCFLKITFVHHLSNLFILCPVRVQTYSTASTSRPANPFQFTKYCIEWNGK